MKFTFNSFVKFVSENCAQTVVNLIHVDPFYFNVFTLDEWEYAPDYYHCRFVAVAVYNDGYVTSSCWNTISGDEDTYDFAGYMSAEEAADYIRFFENEEAKCIQA